MNDTDILSLPFPHRLSGKRKQVGERIFAESVWVLFLFKQPLVKTSTDDDGR